MTITEYLEAKYNRNGFYAITAKEARTLGIKYPLQNGWRIKSGDKKITPEIAKNLIIAIGNKQNEFALRGIQILTKIVNGFCLVDGKEDCELHF